MIDDYLEYGDTLDVEVDTNIQDIQLLKRDTKDWVSKLREHRDAVFFADESFPYLVTEVFSAELDASGSYLVCASRASFGRLSFAIDSIYALKSEPRKEGGLYTRAYNMYVNEYYPMKPTCVITEDLTSGHDIVEHIVNVGVISAGGNANVKATVEKNLGDSLYVIVDGAAYGQFIRRLLSACKGYDNVKIVAPECFEWLLLNTYVFKRFLTDELTATYKYADTIKYGTWENYYEALIRTLIQRYPKGHYNKETWNELYKAFKSPKLLQAVREQLYDLDDSVIDIRL